jgi:hypothetical protein
MVIASIFYMQRVLGALEPIERRIHRYTITLFQQDMAMALSDKNTTRNDGFVLWQLLVGLIGSQTYQKDEKDRRLLVATQFFQMALRKQASVLGITSWSEARTILKEVVWPAEDISCVNVKGLWDEAVFSPVAS